MPVTLEDLDVLIVGAGLSGIGAAYHLQDRLPGRSYAILEARSDLGGTWDLFRYPGIRSDSDMHTLGYRFKPWTETKSITDGPSILRYVRETAQEHGIDRNIRFHHRVLGAEWSSEDARWTVEAERSDTGETVRFSCGFLCVCSGYYRYDEGYTPEFPGQKRFGGSVVHPQHWPEDLDYAGKRVVVIGSGATAMTLVPAMAEKAAKVTMLQRSPTYIASLPAADPVAKALRRVLPHRAVYAIVRWKNVLLQTFIYQLEPPPAGAVKALIRRGLKRALPPGYDIDTHFNPSYNPWDQRMCLVPDGDLFGAITDGSAEVVTDRVATFTEGGIELESGRELEADIIVTATGLNLLFLGGMRLSVDGEAVDLPKTMAYKGMMLSGVPNFAFTLGYTNASWTLKADLVSEYVCRLLAHMDARGYDRCVPEADPSVAEQPLLDFNAGYVLRSIDQFPKQGSSEPWKLRHELSARPAGDPLRAHRRRHDELLSARVEGASGGEDRGLASGQALQALGQPVHPTRSGCLRGRRPIRGAIRGAVDTGIPQSGDVLEGEQFLPTLDQGPPQLRPRLADRVVEDRLETAVAAQQLGGGLRPHPLRARDAVGWVAAQGDEVGHLLGIDAIAVAHLLRRDLFGAFVAGADVEHRHAVSGALVHVAIAGQQQRTPSGLDLAASERAEQVVRLERLAPRHRPTEGFEEGRAVCPLGGEAVRHLIAIRVIGGKELGSVGGGVRAEAEDDGSRVVRFHLAQDQVGRAEQGVDRLAVGPLDRVGQGVEGPEQHRWGVDHEQRRRRRHRKSLWRSGRGAVDSPGMGFISPAPPPFEIDEWRGRPHLERIKWLAQDWALNGFGTPYGVYLLYVVKLVLYAGGGLLLISATTDGLGGLGDIGSWWTEPIVFQKAVVWTMLWEVLGLGAGSLPLTLRFSPMIGGILYWLRPGTTRLPPWPERVPLTRGTTRSVVDVALYAGLIAAALFLLLSDGVSATGSAAGRLDPVAVGALLALLVLLGLRDKVPFLAARAEVYGNLMILFLFPLSNMIIAAQLVFVCIWWGAASSKLNHHFPFVVTVMISNTPWNRWRAAKRRLYRDHPGGPEALDDRQPDRASRHRDGVHAAADPARVEGRNPGHDRGRRHGDLPSPHPLHLPSGGATGVEHLHDLRAALPLRPLRGRAAVDARRPAADRDPRGHLRRHPGARELPPGSDLVPALDALLRRQLGDEPVAFKKDSRAEEKLDREIVKSAPIVTEQLAKFYEPELIEVLIYKGLAFRSMHSHGRALNGLVARAVDDVESYRVREGELVAGVVLGYNFGDGHFHGRQLLEAVQERCRFEPGELRVIALESQPAHVQRQRYRIFDAATGLVEEGWVNVADMVERQPWLDERPFPVVSVAAADSLATPAT